MTLDSARSNLWFVSLIAAGALLATGCNAADAVVRVAPDARPETSVPGAELDAGKPAVQAELGTELVRIDKATVERFPATIEAFAAGGVPTDDRGLLGRNREWGALYSPRFQLGGLALRVFSATGDVARAAKAFRAIEVTTDTIQGDGTLPSSVPNLPEFGGQQPSAADAASAAAFFLGDACLALQGLLATARADEVASRERRERATKGLARAVTWLETKRSLLSSADKNAPNRLFHDALAFEACGALTGSSARGRAVEFVDAAMAQFNANDGTYVEGGGFDTSYQAVNVTIAVDLLLAGHILRRPALETQLASATRWCAGRTTNDGRVDSSGNKRTCGGCETFLPGDPPKQLSILSWFRALVWTGTLFADSDALAGAGRFEKWLSTKPAASCFSRDTAGVLQPFSAASCRDGG